MLKPDTFLDEDLAKVSHAARWLFAALWTLADREGRLEDRPHKIRALTFPYEPQIDIEALLGELARTKENGGTFLTRYESEGFKVIQLTNFAKHQKPHIREAMSVLPKPRPEKPGKGTPKANLAGTRPPVPVSVPDTVPVRTEQPVQPPSSPSVDSRTDADAARADVRDALKAWLANRPELPGGFDDYQDTLNSVTAFHAPTGPVRLATCENVNLMRATAAKIRAHGRPKPAKARKVTAPTWELMANSEQEAMRTAAIRWVEENWHLDAEPGDYESLSTLIRSANPPEDIAVAVSLIIRGRYPTLKHGEAYPCADELCTMGGCILARSASLAPSPEAHDGPTNETSVDTSHQGAETHEIGAKGPAPKTPALPRPALSLTVAPGSCPECGSPLRHSTEGGETILRCSDDQGFGCMWAAVWRSVAA